MCLFSHRTLQDTPQDQSHTVGHSAVYPSGIAFAFARGSRFVREPFADRTPRTRSTMRIVRALHRREPSRTALRTALQRFRLTSSCDASRIVNRGSVARPRRSRMVLRRNTGEYAPNDTPVIAMRSEHHSQGSQFVRASFARRSRFIRDSFADRSRIGRGSHPRVGRRRWDRRRGSLELCSIANRQELHSVHPRTVSHWQTSCCDSIRESRMVRATEAFADGTPTNLRRMRSE